MAIAYRSGTTAGNATGGNLTITKPAGTVDGDILVVVLYREAGTWTLPSGWTQVGSDQRDFNNQLYLTLAWKRASSEGANYTFNLSTTTWRIAAMGAFSGCVASGSPIDTSVGRGTNEDTGLVSAPIASSITTTVADTMRVVLHGNFNGTTPITVGTSGMTRGANIGGVEIWYALQAAAGASGDKTFAGFGGADRGDWATIHLALLPATATPTYTGHAALVPSALTLAASGAFAVPTFAGVAALLPSALTLSASGAFVAPTYAGRAGLVLDALTLAAVGSHTPSTFSGMAALRPDALILAASGAHTAPTFTGHAALALDALRLAARGSVDPVHFVGSAAFTLEAMTLAASGAHVPSTMSGRAALVVPALTLAAMGSHTPSTVDGNAALTLPALSLAVVGQFIAAGSFIGRAALTPELLTLAATGTTFSPSVAGVARLTPSALTLAASGSHTPSTFNGHAALVVDRLTLAAWGNASAYGVFTGHAALVLPSLQLIGVGGYQSPTPGGFLMTHPNAYVPVTPLDSFRRIFQWNPRHFWGWATPSGLSRNRAACPGLLREYGWQDQDAAARSGIREALKTAERVFTEYLTYAPIAHWTECTVPYPRLGDLRVERLYPAGADGRRLAIRLDEGYVNALGVFARDTIGTIPLSGSVPYVGATPPAPYYILRDRDNDGIADQAEIAIATSVTEDSELALYVSTADRYDGSGLDERWRIAPANVTISGGVATLTCGAWLLARPILYEGDQGAPANGLDPADVNNYLQSITVCRRYTNQGGTTLDTAMAVLTWETVPGPWWCQGSADPAAIAQVVARVGIRDAESGLVTPAEAVYDTSAGAWVAPSWDAWGCREPDRVTVRSYAGVIPNGDGTPQGIWEQALMRYVAAELARPVCSCQDANKQVDYWQTDLAQTGSTDKTFAIPPDLANPLGTRRGHLDAWRRIADQQLITGISI